jgi:hypothetical protein
MPSNAPPKTHANTLKLIDDFACPNGNPESGSILMALYWWGGQQLCY